MTLNKQLINLLGILVAVIVLVAGLALIALPMYSQSRTIDANATTVAQTNATYQAQIDGLSAANERVDEIDRSLADLRTQIAATPKLDDVYEIIGTIAQRADVRIESISAEDAAPWIPRSALDADGNPVAVETDSATESTESTETDSTDATTDSGTATDATPAPTTPEESPQQQVLLTVTIDVAQPYAVTADAEVTDTAVTTIETDAAAARVAATEQAQKAAAFVDDLAGGPRLLSPINVEYTGGKLTISVLTFIRTENAQ